MAVLTPTFELFFKSYFNQENSNEVNAALLEILQYYPENAKFYNYVRELA